MHPKEQPTHRMPPPNLRPLMGWRVRLLMGPVDLTCHAEHQETMFSDCVKLEHQHFIKTAFLLEVRWGARSQ